jgi:hypothetical protein
LALLLLLKLLLLLLPLFGVLCEAPLVASSFFAREARAKGGETGARVIVLGSK